MSIYCFTQFIFNDNPNKDGKSQMLGKVKMRVVLEKELIVAREQINELHFGDAVVRCADIVQHGAQYLRAEKFLQISLKFSNNKN